MFKYYYGVMASGKSLSLLVSAFQEEKNGNDVLVLKPYDERDKDEVTSRVGLKRKCITFNKEDNLLNLVAKLPKSYTHIYIDECQFLTKEQIIQLWRLSKIGMEVLCFGLKTNFKNELFDSISTLMVYADKIKAIQPSCSCKHCGDIATTHLLIVDGKVVLDFPEKFEGDVEGSTRFECVCQKCWHNKTKDLRK